MASLADIKKDIKQLSSGGISKTELEKIAKQNKTSAASVVKQIDIVNKNAPSFQTALNSGAANMLINQLSTAPRGIFTQSPTAPLGTGQIGRTLSGMVGSPAGTGGYINPRSGAQRPVSAAVAPQLMIGGTQIRPGGRVAVAPMGAAPAIGDTMATTTTGDGTTAAAADDGTTAGDQFDFQSMLDALTAMQQPTFDMGALQEMFQAQFDQLSSQFDQMNPLQLAQLGRAYGSDAIRARQNIRKTRQDYRRGLPAMALGQTLASLGIGGGLTL